MAVEATTPARQALLDAYRSASGLSGAEARPLIEALWADWPRTISRIAADELVAEFLATTPIYPAWLEASMTQLRRKLMMGQASEALSGLLSNLAIQCHLNEYAWAVEPRELERVADLSRRAGDLSPVEAMLLGCYVALDRVPGAERLAARGWTGPVLAVLDEQITGPQQERALDGRIPRITPIRHGVSEEVRGQYEANPYPRWRRQQALPPMSAICGWRVPAQSQVLIAGCGTGFHAIRSAGRLPGSKVLAADLSRASLAYGFRKARELGRRNVAFAQADLLELGPGQFRFDIVESSGVLHHMADPFAGARAICNLLKPGGVIKLGLYSATGRRGLKPAKALAQQYAPDTIRELRQAIMAAPQGDPLRDPLRFIDFYATSPCRDLLMPVQEHELGFADLRLMLAENGLTFLAFVIGDEVTAAYRQRFPEDPEARDLDRWEAFEQERPDTFAGMYQFWAVKTGSAAVSHAASSVAADGERGRLLKAFRSGQGATDALAAETAQFLARSWGQGPTMAQMARDELLAELLQSSPIFPVWLERAMTRVRRRLLFAAPGEAPAHLVARLAIQCHLNEYAWAEDAAETEAVENLAANLAALTPDQVMTLACYRPLARLAGADALLTKGWDGPAREVLHEQIVTVREEAAIAAALPTLTPVRGGVSQAVRAQYEANPYPRWRRVGPGPVMADVRGRPLPPEMDVLIAGCGTGRQAIQSALMLPGSRTLAVDLSRASLAYAVRKTRELGLSDRITYAQADLLELDDGRRFDMVQSAGVLHHMADPFEGARRVCRLAKPGGFIALGLYSARARDHLRPAKALGKSYSPETVRAFRQAIIDAPDDDPVRGPAVASRDFYATSGCRDLLMHVQEHELGIADLRRILDENGLTFLGFHQFGFKHVRDPYRAMFPHDPTGVDLDAWDAFEAEHPATFRRMYQFWAVKAG